MRLYIPIFFALLPISLAAQAPVFPAAVVDDSQLKVAINGTSLYLYGVTDNVQTTFYVSGCSSPNQTTPVLAVNVLITIDQEIMPVASCSGTSLVVQSRGYDGTTPAPHNQGSVVAANIDAWHRNTDRVEIEAIETALGANLYHVFSAFPPPLGYTFDGQYLTLAAACSAAGPTGTLVVSHPWTALATQTLACNIVFTNNGTIQPAANQTLTLEAASCPAYQRCFDTTTNSNAAIIFTAIPSNLNPVQFGAQGLGVAGAAQDIYFQAAANAINASGGGTMNVYPASLPYALQTGTQVFPNFTYNLLTGATVTRVNNQTGTCVPAQKFGCLALVWSDLSTNPTNIHVVGQGVLDGNRAGNPGVGAGGAANCVFVEGWINSSVEVTCQNSPSDGITVTCSGPSSTTYSSANTNCGDNILIKGLLTNATRNDLTIIGGTRITVQAHMSYANGVSPQAGVDVEPDFAGQHVTGLTFLPGSECDHNSGPTPCTVALNFTSEPNLALSINLNSHDNASGSQALTVSLPNVSGTVSISGIFITGNYAGVGAAGIVLDNENYPTQVFQNVTIAANVSGTNAIGSGGVTNLILAGGSANGSLADCAFNSTTFAGAVAMAFVNNTCVATLTSTATSISLGGPIAVTAGAGALDMVSTNPSFRMRSTNAVSVANNRTFELVDVSNNTVPASYLQARLINDAHSVFTNLFNAWASGGFYVGSTPTDPGAGNLLVQGTGSFLGLATASLSLNPPCAATASAGCINMISTNPSIRMRNTNTLSVANNRTFECLAISNNTVPASYYQCRLINDAQNVFTNLFNAWASGGFYIGSNPTSDPGAGNLLVQGNATFQGLATAVGGWLNHTTNFAGLTATGCTGGNYGLAFWGTWNASTFNAGITGDGGTIGLAICNGSAWTLH